MNPHGPRAGWIGRVERRAGFDRNPMRRAGDRVQAILRAVLVAVFVIGGPVMTAYVSHEVYLAGLQTGRAQAAAWHRVPALVVHVRAIPAAWRHPAIDGLVAWRVRWTTPSGSSRTGEITSARHVVAGSTVTVWIDASGRLAHPPFTRADSADRAIGAAVATPALLALLLWIAARAASLVLDRHRLTRWEADWLVVEPQWTKGR
jgi:hypothetical protein